MKQIDYVRAIQPFVYIHNGRLWLAEQGDLLRVGAGDRADIPAAQAMQCSRHLAPCDEEGRDLLTEPEAEP